MDLVRSRRELLLENAFLRQQVIVLSRAGKRPAFTGWDRGLLVLLASHLRCDGWLARPPASTLAQAARW